MAQSKSSTPTLDAGSKRKHGSKSRSVRFFDDLDDTSSGSDRSGDGSSSGDSVPSDGPGRKRPRTSRVVTRSSIQAPAPNSGIQDTLTSPSSAIPGVGALSINTITISANLTDPQTPDTPADTDVDDSLSGDSGVPPASSEHASPAIEHETISESGSIAGTPSAVTAVIPPLALLNIIDVKDVPTFLSSHGKGNRRVDIFKYLNAVQDSHFQKVLLHYLKFEVSDKSGASGALPTANRPIEISQWTSRARPSTLPDLTKGNRTFAIFVDSVFTWWGSLQPLWRSFQRDRVSREVQGDWGVLCAPRINGLLNIVILVYWCARALEEQGLDDSVRADYEFLADDVAWVFSRLST